MLQVDERFNCYSHLIGSVASLAGVVVLVGTAFQKGDPWKIVSFSIYGITLFLLFLVSTLYHGSSGSARKRWRLLDHFSIYLLIAGTYTPFTLVTLNGTANGWALFGIIWGLALIGMWLDIVPQPGGRRILPVIVYLLMGWMVLVSLEPLLEVLPVRGFHWLLAGGICYTSGVIFFGLGRYIKAAHGIWHLFVLGGSACHYWAIFAYVL